MHNQTDPHQALAVQAIDLLHAALADVTAREAAAVIARADLDQMTELLGRILSAATAHGIHAGWRLGYLASEQDTADAWRPIAERVRDGADKPAYADLLRGLDIEAA